MLAKVEVHFEVMVGKLVEAAVGYEVVVQQVED